MEKQLLNFPKGNLVCTRNGSRFKWYLSDNHEFLYLSKKQRKLAEKLAVKKYLSLQLKEAKQEKQALEYYLKHCERECESEKLLSEDSGYRELLTSYFTPKSKELSDWMKSPYETNTKHPERLIHNTVSGQIVRSKSEVLIATSLSTHHIPFRYECKLLLGNITVYPDFTIRHPVTGEQFYWEHFGKMDSPEYCKRTCQKLTMYAEQGILPGIHLIATYETEEHPLTVEVIERTVKEYFM